MSKNLRDFNDFTERHYAEILDTVQKHYEFRFFENPVPDKPHVVWRHDMDASVHRALGLARIERDHNVASTYFVRLHSEFYNVLERDAHRCIKLIMDMGHRIGLHFEGEFYGGVRNQAQLETLLVDERRMLKTIFGCDISAFSFHNPEATGLLKFDKDVLGGMVNTYGRTIKDSYRYCSDSNGYWRHDRLYDIVGEPKYDKLHILTHPEWWQKRPMTPKARIRRAVRGRSRHTMESYLALLRSAGREDI